jgi:hypothetical protein
MFSDEELENLKKEGLTPEESRLYILVFVCLLTAVLAGLTVFAMNGDIEWTVHHNDYYGGEWDEYRVLHIGPATQGFLGFTTMGFFLLSIYLLMVRAAEKGKGGKG